MEEKDPTADQTEALYMYFIYKMKITEQFVAYGFLAYIAECGGFIGLFLGFSLLQLEEIMVYIENKKLSSMAK